MKKINFLKYIFATATIIFLNISNVSYSQNLDKLYEKIDDEELFFKGFIDAVIKSKDGKYHIIGIRPGEKLHETLCPEENSKDTIEFKNYYLIKPSTDFTKGTTNNYQVNKRKEKGKFVKSNFVYSSDTNPHFLDVKKLKELI